MDKFEMISKMGFDCLRTKEYFENNREMRKELYKKREVCLWARLRK